MSRPWRVIPLETYDAYMNMALDEACQEAVAAREVPATIRFYQWKPSAVSIGYFQSLQDEIDVERCREFGVDYIRRRTGGGAVYHDFDGEITYSVIAPESYLPRGITESYHEICGWIIDGLKAIDIDAKFKPINDIVTGEREQKISGNAQTRRDGVVLQHGTILFEVDVKKMFSVLTVGRDKIADKMIAAVEERVTSIRRLKPDVTKDQVYQALLTGFTAEKEITMGTWSEDELRRAEQIAEERYRSEDWNGMR